MPTPSATLVRVADVRVGVTELLRALPLGGSGSALLLSVSVHAALALTFVHSATHGMPHALQRRDALVEIALLDLALPEVRVQAPPVPSAPSPPLAHPHSHPYPVSPDHDLTPHDPSIEHEHAALHEHAAASTSAAAVPALLEAPAPVTPRFVLTVGATAHSPATGAAVDNRAANPGFSGADEPASEAEVDAPARLLTGNSASYTAEAEAAGVEASVPLEIVVNAAGAVISARALAHVGYGLDEAAMRGVRAYRFAPAKRAGKPLAVRMRWLMRFQLR